jgi:putative peptide zinc metalloprotease protein
MRGRIPVMQAELETARASVDEAEATIALLAPTAPFDGVFYTADTDMKPGERVERNELIGIVAGKAPWSVVAYLDESSTHLVKEGLTARFYPDGRNMEPIKITISSIEIDATRVLPHPMLATAAGGDVQATQVETDLVPAKAVYRLIFTAESVEKLADTHIRRGRVVIGAGSESILTKLFRNTLAVIWREFGF